MGISVTTTKLEAAKCGDRTGAVDAIFEATSCGVDDATIVVFMQWRHQLDNWGGGEYSYLRVLHQLLLKSIDFMVCEHKYMNIRPTPPNYCTGGATVFC